jgi:hypothetical protein
VQAVAVHAQKPVDFSGTWVSATAKPGGASRELIVITQDKTGMTAVFTAEGKGEAPKSGETVRYDFGATKIQSGPAGAPEVSIRSSWRGATLVAVSTVKAGERVRSFQQEWSLDSSGILSLTVIREGAEPRTTTYTRRPSQE